MDVRERFGFDDHEAYLWEALKQQSTDVSANIISTVFHNAFITAMFLYGALNDVPLLLALATLAVVYLTGKAVWAYRQQSNFARGYIAMTKKVEGAMSSPKGTAEENGGSHD